MKSGPIPPATGKRPVVHIGTAVAATVLAIVLWAAVSVVPTSAQTATRTLRGIPLSYDVQTTGSIVTQIPNTVDLVISGPPASVRQVEPGNFTAYVQLNGLSPGTHWVSVHVISDQSVPPQLRVTPQPQQVQVTLQRAVSRQVPVRLSLRGKEADGMQVVQQSVSPPQVTATGSANDVQRVVAALATVDLGAAAQTPSQTVDLQPVDAAGRVVEGVTLSPAQGEVRLQLKQQYKDVPLDVQIEGTPADGYEVTGQQSQPAQVRLYGDPQQLAKIDRLVLPPVDISGQKATLSKVVTVPLPEGVTRVEPTQVTLEVRISPTASAGLSQRSFSGVQVTLQHAPSGASVTPAQVELVVKGASTQLDALRESQLTVIADASGAADGDTLQLRAIVPKGLTAIPSPAQVILHLPAPETQQAAAQSQQQKPTTLPQQQEVAP
ncbi:MAG: hypothetical protein IMW91_01010 [Firmicutes bacterium]|nr:hypothetical protein [Bacillota bacterium]